MERSFVFSGFGGQGALFAGQLLAYAAMDAGKHVTWIPSYGPEMRGGTAHCTVLIGDDPIGSPLVRHPEAVVAMNLPSADKYEPIVAEGGLLVINTSLVAHPIQRTDIRVIHVPANALAEKLGTVRLANMVLLGALLAATQILPIPALEQALRDHLPKRHLRLLDANLRALAEGAALGAVLA